MKRTNRVVWVLVAQRLREADPWLLLLHACIYGVVGGYVLGKVVNLARPRIEAAWPRFDPDGAITMGLVIWGAIGGVLVGMVLLTVRMNITSRDPDR